MPLTRLQRRVGRLLFGLAEARPFALAGGAGLMAHGLIERDTRDIDAFGDVSTVATVRPLADAFTADAQRSGLTVERIQDHDTFIRLLVTDARSTTIVDLAIDEIRWEPQLTDMGPTLDPRELAANKVLALASRMEPRDFVDVFALSDTFAIDDMLAWARHADLGFTSEWLADSLSWIDRYRDEDLGVDPATAVRLRRFVKDLATRLESS